MTTRPAMPEDDDELDDETPLEPSRSRLRVQARDYLDFAEELAKAKHDLLPDPPFDAELRDAIADAQRFLKSARSRQIRRVAQLLRGAGSMDDLRAAVEGRTAAARQKQELERRSEAWRARLIDEGDAALAELLGAHPSAERQRLRQLARQARRSPPDARSKRAATALIRMIRVLLEADAEASAEAGAQGEASAEVEGTASAEVEGTASAEVDVETGAEGEVEVPASEAEAEPGES